MRQRTSGLAVQLAAWLVGGMLTIGCSGDSVVGGSDGGADVVSDMGVTCSTPQTTCGSSCANLQTDPANCGACSHACGTGMLCVAGTCQLSCTGGTACNGTCVDTHTDNANCGACGHACATGQVCSVGVCGTTCAASLATCSGSADGGTNGDAGGATFCADLTNDRLNCGACGIACPAGSICSARSCMATCSVGQTLCSGTCRDLRTENANCGACGNVCPTGTACSAGMCTVSCSTGLTQCTDTCINLDTDNANCGTCGHTCATGQVCSGGMCAATCAAPLATCNGAAASYCANTSIDPSNCGMCGTTCTLPNTTTTGCTDGACGVVRCDPNFGDCDGTPANGCETDTTNSIMNCGGCGRACVLPNAMPVCTAGICAVQTCTTGFADCDGNPANGCEVNLNTENSSCGACGTICGPGQVCSGGTCGSTCAAPLATCTPASGSYCANTQNDPDNCGTCGTACALANTDVQGCTAGSCSVARCTAGFGDCDLLGSTGCETNLLADSANCGACGRACTLPNASATCAAGACGVMACTTGFADCNTAAADGCEVSLQTDNANCGACGHTCGAGQVCSAGTCTTTCAAPLTTCGTAPSQYCANTSIDPMNCGTCGTACSLPNAAQTACASGGCVVDACNPSFGDCDGMAGNGCETNLAASNGNCGACGHACTLANATATCTSSVCAVSACATGFADCDANPATGCEVPLLSDNANCGACGHTCAAGQVCSAGACTTTCAAPLTTCTVSGVSACANTSLDPANCGSCGHACALANAATNVCNSGVCLIATCGTGFGNCNATASDGCEANLNTDNANCGACAHACSGGQTCSAGSCVCPTGQTLCGGVCVNLTNSAANCGICSHACALTNATSACTASTCTVTTCGTGFADCNTTAADGCEINTQTDSTNCGSCGHACSAGQVCSRGACTTTCAAPLSTCTGTGGASYCANTTIDPANCGACGTVCSLAHTAVSSCGASACTVATCNSGFGDCNATASDGCETNLLTSGTSCGACGRACTLGNATATCAAGTCGIAACNTNFANCNAIAADGCEVSLLSDNANCGSCGHTCGAGQVCSSGVCTTTCASPLTTCGTSAAAFCANTSNDPNNCGSCSHVCALANTSADGCASGACTVLTCTTGFGNCNGTASDGCETNLNTTASSCGACGRSCTLANASSSCTGGACAITTCSAGFLDCNASAADGCEVSISTDNANCGTCGHGCAAGQVCSAGSCVATCAAPLSLCSGGCVNLTNDPSRCGTCTTTCAAGPNSVAVCAASSCAYVCSSGFADCDRAAANGCEVNVNTSTASCGTCGHACTVPANATATCTGGTCGYTCNSGFGDCDGVASNGCEVNLNTSPTHCGTCATSCTSGVCTAGSCGFACYAGPYRVLVLGPAANNSTDSSSFFPAGTVVTVASNAMWTSMTTANFGQYDLLWVGGQCTGDDFSAFLGSQAAWGPAVASGRIEVTTTDAALHASSGNTSAQSFISHAVTYLGGLGRNADGGHTGLYFSTGCSGLALSAYAATLGTGLNSTGGGGDPNVVTTAGMASPLLTGQTASSLSWGSYAHSLISGIPAGYTDLSEVGSVSVQILRDVTCH